MTGHIDPNEIPLVAEPEDDLVLRALVGRDNGTDDLSLTWIQLEGRHREIKIGKTTRLYYILQGSFVFEIRGRRPVTARVGEVVVLDPGSSYSFSGSGTYLVINGPAFSEGDDTYLE